MMGVSKNGVVHGSSFAEPEATHQEVPKASNEGSIIAYHRFHRRHGGAP
jgi:hypothetical protein